LDTGHLGISTYGRQIWGGVSPCGPATVVVGSVGDF
jgi:hypothetical protein